MPCMPKANISVSLDTRLLARLDGFIDDDENEYDTRTQAVGEAVSRFLDEEEKGQTE